MKDHKTLELEREFIYHCVNILEQKRQEYTNSSNNRYIEFEWCARRLRCDPLEHLEHLLHKHLFCINEIKESLKHNPSATFSKDYLLEKFGDAYNYCILGRDYVSTGSYYDA